jgi:drug/metabolite transporter (DMT)-like permease
MAQDQPQPQPGPRAPAVRIALAFAAIYLVWGSTYLAIRIAVAEVPPLLMAGTRMLAAGTVLFLLARRGGVPAPTEREWRGATLGGGLLFLVGNGSLSWAEQRVPSGLAAIVMATIPLFAVLLEAVGGKGPRPGGRVALGLALGLGGVAVLATGAPGAGPGLDRVAVLVMLVGALAWAVGSTPWIGRGLPRSRMMGAASQMLAGGALLLLAGVAAGEGARVTLGAQTARAVLAVGYLVVFGSLVGFTAYHWLLGVVPASQVATYAFVNPLVAVLLGWTLGGETIGPRELVAAAAVVAAVVLIVTRPALPAAVAAGGGATKGGG